MILNADLFYSKLLLFGEYSVIMGSMALSVPYGHFRGELNFIHEDKTTDLEFAASSNKVLEDFTHEALKNHSHLKVGEIIDLEALARDVDQGLYFESTIPQGYGLGSSGALIAAVYSRYAFEERRNPRLLTQPQLNALKEKLSRLEAYFHGSSSGLDPLSCYIKLPLLIRSDCEIATINLPRNKITTPGGIFLVNTGKPRKTQFLVRKFMQRMDDPNFAHKFRENYIPWTNKCITSLASGNMREFSKNLALLSRFQIRYMRELVSEEFAPLWEEGIRSKDYYLKLCGSGGGGFMLGFTENIQEVTTAIAKHYPVITVYKTNGR